MQQDQESERLSQQKSEQLRILLSVLFILAGSVFDVADAIIHTDFATTWTNTHLLLKDLRSIGMALLLFTICPYSSLKIKTLSFMLILWRTSVFLHNTLLPDPPVISFILLPMYAVYIIFLYRVYTLDDWPPVFLNSQNYQYIENTTKSFNVLLPISTFRGLLQILFTRSSPKYETRLLISGNHIYSVQKSRFVKQDYDHKIIQDLMEKAGARIKLLGLFTPDDRLKYDKLLGKRTFTGIRDCRRLEA